MRQLDLEFGGAREHWILWPVRVEVKSGTGFYKMVLGSISTASRILR